MNEINITSAQYVSTSYDSSINDHITAVVNGEALSVPIFVGNKEYDEIMRQVNAGTLTIQDAD